MIVMANVDFDLKLCGQFCQAPNGYCFRNLCPVSLPDQTAVASHRLLVRMNFYVSYGLVLSTATM